MTLMAKNKVSEAEARAVLPITAESRSYKPVRNDELLDMVAEVANAYGLVLNDGQYALDRDDGRMFAQYAINGTDGEMIGGEAVMQLGIRNSSDKSLPAEICFGSRIIVCDNLIFVATSKDGICGKASHRHTRNVQSVLMDRLVESFGQFQTWKTWQEKFYTGLKTVPVNNESAALSIVEAAKQGAIKKTNIVDIYDEWVFQERGIANAIEQQQHDEKIHIWHPEFQKRNAYNLFNAFTEIAKIYQKKSPVNAPGKDMALVKYFDKVYTAA